MKNLLKRAFTLFLALFTGIAIAGTVQAAYHFGTAWDESHSNGDPTDKIYLDDEKAGGINARNVYIRWSDFEPVNNTWSTTYIDQKKEEVRQYREAGFDVILRINFFPVPSWYFVSYPQARFKNQHLVEWRPEQASEGGYGLDRDEWDSSAISIWENGTTNPYKTEIQQYIAQVRSELGTDFWAVYVSAGQYGEVSYPAHVLNKNDDDYPVNHGTEDFQGNNNCYWAWDENARNDLEATYSTDSRIEEIKAFKPGMHNCDNPYAGERITNGSFEDTYYLNLLDHTNSKAIAGWKSTWTTQPGLWQPIIETSGSSIGAQYLQLNTSGGSQNALRQVVQVNTGVAYSFSAFLKATNGSEAVIKLTQLNDDDVFQQETIISSSSITWDHKIENIALMSSTTKVQIDLYATGANASFDGLSLTDGTTTDHYVAQKFLEWYYQSLIDYMNWAIRSVRAEFPTNRLFLMEGGYAGMAGDMEIEINDDLMGKSKNNYWVRRGFLPDNYLAGLTTANKNNLYFLNTAMELTERAGGEPGWKDSVLYTDFCPPQYFAELANKYGLGKFGENAGSTKRDAYKAVFQNMVDFDYEGVAWYTVGQLFEPHLGYATIQDYISEIKAKNNLPEKPATGSGIDPVITSWEYSDPKAYDNIVFASNNVEGYDLYEYEKPLCTVTTKNTATNNSITAFTGDNYLVVAGHIASVDPAYCYYWLMNDALIPYNNIVITDGMKLRYRIYHLDNGDAGNNHIAVDFYATDPDGSNPVWLRDSGVEDQNQISMHPAQRQDPVNEWHYVEADLSSLENKVIQQVMIGFDDPNVSQSSPKRYRAYIDDLRFSTDSVTYAEEFDGPADMQPKRWWNKYNAEIKTNGSGEAIISLSSETTFGDVQSPIIYDLDTNHYNTLQFSVSNVTDSTYLDIGLQEERGERRFYSALGQVNQNGVHRVSIPSVTGGADLSAFSIQCRIVGTAGTSEVVLDSVKIKYVAPAPTVTVTPTMTATPTLTMTPSATLTPTITVTPIPTEFAYSTFHGGSGEDNVQDTFVDALGQIYVVGSTQSNDLPVTTDAYDSTYSSMNDGFLTKYGADGKTILYCTYFGGSEHDAIQGVTVDNSGNIYVTGATWSGDFPVVNGMDSTRGGQRDAFVAKFNSAGQLVYSTYLGGSNYDYGFCIDVEQMDIVYVGGFTHGGFPTTAGAAQPGFGGYGDGFITKLNLITNTIEYSTYLGGQYWESVSALKVKNGAVYATGGTQSPNFPITADAIDQTNSVPAGNQGADGFFTKLSNNGSTFEYSTFIGPEQSPSTTGFNEIALDSTGNVYLVGATKESGFATTAGAIQTTFGGGDNDGMVVKLSSNYQAVLFSTFLGGPTYDECTDVQVDSDNNIWVTGYTDSATFLPGTQEMGGQDSFNVYMDPFGRLLWSNRMGGSANDGNGSIHVKTAMTTANKLVVAGTSSSPDFPVSTDAQQSLYGGIRDGTLSILHQPDYIILPEMTITTTATITATPTASATVTATPTVTTTSTPGPAVYWEDGLSGTPGEQPAGWRDDSELPVARSIMQYTPYGSARIFYDHFNEEPGWGKVLSPIQYNCNIDQYSYVEIRVNYVVEGVTWKIGIQEEDHVNGNYQYFDLGGSIPTTGTFAFNFKQATGWSGVHPFSIQIVVEGAHGHFIDVDYVRIINQMAEATATMTATLTPTPTVSNTEIVTMTPTPTPTLPITTWIDEFEGTPGSPATDWEDEHVNSLYNCYANIGDTSSIGEIIRTTEDVWGKVLSPQITCDVSRYKYIEIKTTDLSAGKNWKIGVQEIGGNWLYWDLSSSMTTIGTNEFDIASVTGWTGEHTFAIQIVVEGEAGTKLLIDYIRVHRGAVQGAVVNYGVAHTDTSTPTMTPTSSITPAMQYTTTPSPTPTATMTPTPFVVEKEIIAFPNPAQDVMTFAYTISGGVHVILDIYKINGERVARVDEYKDGGSGQTLRTVWDAVNVSPGIYIARLKITDEAGKIVMDMKKKVALIK